MYETGPLPQFISNQYYSNLILKYRSELVAPKEKRNEILKKSYIYRVLRRIYRICKSILSSKEYFYLPLIIIFIIWGELIFGFLLFVLVLLIAVLLLSGYLKTKYKNRCFNLNNEILSRLDKNAEKATNVILEKWEYYNVTFEDYPPDWNDRRRRVLKRDNFKCTICGWPKGFKRKIRNLHVHHTQPISKNGSNSIDNLTTLCHICHRKKPGIGHKQIKYKKKRK